MHDFGGEILKCRDHQVVWMWQCGSVAPWPVNVKKPMHRKHLITRNWELELATSISPGAVFHRPFWKYQLPWTITPAQVIDNRPGGGTTRRNRNKQPCLSSNKIVDPFLNIAIYSSVENNGRGNDFFSSITSIKAKQTLTPLLLFQLFTCLWGTGIILLWLTRYSAFI